MKPLFLFIVGLMISGLVFMSMTDRMPVLSTVIDNVEITDVGTSTVTDYVVERTIGGGGPGTGVVLKGTRTTPPVANNDGGYNYRCVKSEEICYQCSDCTIQSQSGG